MVYLKPINDEKLITILCTINNYKNYNLSYYFFIFGFYQSFIYEKEKITPIKNNNQTYIPLTVEYMEKKHKIKLSNKQEQMIAMVGKYKNSNREEKNDKLLFNEFRDFYVNYTILKEIKILGEYKNSNRKEENDRLLFDAFGGLYINNKILNITATILFSIIGMILNSFINKSFQLENAYIIIYIFYTFLNLFCLHFWFNLLDLTFGAENLFIFIFMKSMVLLIVIFSSIFFGSLYAKVIKNIKFSDNRYNKYMPELLGVMFTISGIFSLQYLLFWKFYTYPTNKKYFDKNIKPKFYEKFNKLKGFLLTKNYSCYGSLTGLKDLYLNFIPEDKEKEFNKEILSL